MPMYEFLKYTLIFCTLHITMMPGEILQAYARFVNFNDRLPNEAKKLLTCAACIGFWTSLIIDRNIELSCAVFIAVYFFQKYVK